MVATTSAAERRQAAKELYDVLVVPDPAAVEGMFIVVFDDVFTGGHTLNADATCSQHCSAPTSTMAYAHDRSASPQEPT